MARWWPAPTCWLAAQPARRVRRQPGHQRPSPRQPGPARPSGALVESLQFRVGPRARAFVLISLLVPSRAPDSAIPGRTVANLWRRLAAKEVVLSGRRDARVLAVGESLTIELRQFGRGPVHQVTRVRRHVVRHGGARD